MNMWSLWILGPLVEQVTGRLRFAVLYLLSALGSSVLVYLIAPDANVYGASGAIFGLAGAYFVICRRLERDIWYANRLIAFSLIWLVATAWFVSWEGHVGGLLAGGALGLAYAAAPAKRRTAVPGRRGGRDPGDRDRARGAQDVTAHRARPRAVLALPPRQQRIVYGSDRAGWSTQARSAAAGRRRRPGPGRHLAAQRRQHVSFAEAAPRAGSRRCCGRPGCGAATW